MFVWFPCKSLLFAVLQMVLSCVLFSRCLPSCHGASDNEGRVGRRIEITQDIENDGQIILLELGKHMPNSRVDAVLLLSNKTGNDLKFVLKPSCGCTHLSIETLAIPANGSESIRFDMLVPMSGVKQANIRCQDAQNAFGFVVDLKVEASEPVKFAKDRLTVVSNDSEPLEVRLATNGHGVQIVEAELEPGSRWLIQKVSADDTGWMLFLRKQLTIPTGIHEEYMRLNCTVVEKGERALIPLELRIEFADRFRLGPSFVVPKLLGDKVSFTLFATGASVRSSGAPKLFLKG